jgi:hypothetical protein
MVYSGDAMQAGSPVNRSLWIKQGIKWNVKFVVAGRTGTVINACRREGCCEVVMGSDADIRLRADVVLLASVLSGRQDELAEAMTQRIIALARCL